MFSNVFFFFFFFFLSYKIFINESGSRFFCLFVLFLYFSFLIFYNVHCNLCISPTNEELSFELYKML